MSAEADSHFAAWKSSTAANQTKYLGSDLNPSGISSLEPEAATFNTRAKERRGKIDVVNKTLGDYASSIRP